MNRARLTALPLAVILTALTLSGCKLANQPAAQETSAAPETKPGVSAANARVVLPAVPGNPGAAYFTLDNQSAVVVSVASVAVDGAGKSEIHTGMNGKMSPVARADAEPRTQLNFEPGKLHVMLFDLGNLKPGTATELTMTFSDGDKLSIPAKVQAMGDSAMGGMQH